MLAPRSARAKHSHPNSGNQWTVASREAQLEVEIRKISMKFQSYERCTVCPLFPRLHFHLRQVEFEVSIYETPLLVVIAFNSPSVLANGVDRKKNRTWSRCLVGIYDFAIPTVLVLVPTILIVGLAVVLHGRKTGWSDLVCHRWRTVYTTLLKRFITGLSRVELELSVCRDVELEPYLSIQKLGRYTEVERSYFTVATLALLRSFEILDLTFDTISAIENALGKVRDCQHGLYTAGGVSRVDEMILARERSGFAGKKVWDDIPVVTGFVWQERRLLEK
ncbi:hypothetical protein Tco_1282841 [Tanacetum coccineum]